MEKVLITGGAGFIGSHLTRTLLSQGHEVHLLVRLSTTLDNLSDIRSNIHLHTVDIGERAQVEQAIQEIKPTRVFHLAASTLMSGKTAGVATLVHTNIEGSINLMDAALAAGVTAFINIGSFVEYGPKDHPTKEDERCDPVELYAISKLAATLYGQGLAKRAGFPCVTFRLFTPYGPGIQPGRLIRTLIEKISAGESIALSTPTTARDFIYVEDIVSLLIKASEIAAHHKGEIFNLGTGSRTTLVEVIKEIEQAVGKTAEPQWNVFPLQSYDSELWQADMSKTFGTFTWRPSVSLTEGIKKTVAVLL